MNDVVILDRVTRRFGANVALDDVSFRVPPGVVFGLLGENGAGKTTALRLMLGLGVADHGTVKVLGHDCHREGLAIRQKVGYVAERPTFYEWMTAMRTGWFAAGFYPDGYEQRYRQLLQRFGVAEQKRLRQMSKGTRAKVSLALALAHDPQLLILDEPTSGLDTIVRHEFLQSMVDRAADGGTVLLSSHQIQEVERVADIVAILHQGRLAVCEPLDQLKATTTVITFTSNDPTPQCPALPGQILHREQRGHQWQLLTRHVPLEAVHALANHGGTLAVETRTPSLEEIFVAYIQDQGNRRDVDSKSRSQAVTESTT